MVGTIIDLPLGAIAVAVILLAWRVQRNNRLTRAEITNLQRENLILAKAIKTLRTDTDGHCNDLKKMGEDVKSLLSDREKQLTSAPAKPKIEPKPHRANWRTFRSLAEKATEEQEQEA